MLLGDADTDTEAADLPRNEEAMAQGAHRFARGLWHFAHCQALAKRRAIPFGWRLEVVRGAGHIDQVLFDRSAELFASTER